MTERELIDLAIKASENAYAPYSNFRVGAALECADGEIFLGCNVESGSYGATICAERTAFSSAVAAGKREFRRIAVVSSGEDICTPCGICRQFIFELAPDLRVICASPSGEWVEYGREELLPHAFEL